VLLTWRHMHLTHVWGVAGEIGNHFLKWGRMRIAHVCRILRSSASK